MHALIRSFTVIVLAVVAAGFAPKQPPRWTPISHEEAKILAYLTPFGAEHRKAGLDVQPITGCGVPVANKPFVDVELVSTQPFGARGAIEDHEYVVVNLNTAEVLDPIQIPATEIKSSELFGVAAIMREAHGIDGQIIQRYAGLQPQATQAPPCHH